MRILLASGIVGLLAIAACWREASCLSTSFGGSQAQAEQAKDVRAGTALAKLVEETQGHPLMKGAAAPSTSTGRRIRSDIPTWLRAHYMRNHSQVLTAANSKDPTGGFPLALESLYVWMLRHQDLQPPPAPPARAAAPAVAVGQNLRISAQN